METNFFSYTKNYVPSLPYNNHTQKKLNHTPILAVLTKHPGKISRLPEKPIPKPAEYNLPGSSTTKTVYNDSWFDQLAINHLSQCVQATTGLKNEKTGYEGLIQATMDIAHKFSIIQQRELVLQALDRAIPRPILYLIRTVLPASKFTREYFAAFTALFFPWLIGPCEVRESVLNGSKEKHVVHIKKCRFLEQSNCAGMCTNLCKIPSQIFIKESFGMPVNMVPNFEDMSCEMKFGEEAPPLSQDPALRQPCYKLCKKNKSPEMKCPT